VTASPLTLSRARRLVLVVDDDADNRELYVESFSLAGWNVTHAANGREALVWGLVAAPSIIVTELRLPIIDGISLCEILRRDRATRGIPILVVTAETRPEQLERATRAGATALLIKPSAPDVVMAEMRRLVQESDAALPSDRLTVNSGRTALVKVHPRYWTTTPAEAALPLVCPICTRLLTYRETFMGGVSRLHPERWDYYECSTCGRFQYRWRTRKLRRIS